MLEWCIAEPFPPVPGRADQRGGPQNGPHEAGERLVFSYVHFQNGTEHLAFEPLISGRPLALPFAVAGELQATALRGKLGPKRRSDLERAIGSCVVIPTDARVVEQWAELWARFKGRLENGGVNDMWIAACCLVHDLPSRAHGPTGRRLGSRSRSSRAGISTDTCGGSPLGRPHGRAERCALPRRSRRLVRVADWPCG
jgi:predicted nucleic acid-binding protein